MDITKVMGQILSYQHLHFFFGPAPQFVFIRHLPHDNHVPKLKRRVDVALKVM
jgi:hypothetical protein